MNTQEPLAILKLRTDRNNAETSGQMYLDLSPDFQREYEPWSEKLSTRLIESVFLNRGMNPIWVVTNSNDNCEDVLDGMHRLKTLLNFMDGQFEIGQSLTTISVDEYKGKKFTDLSIIDKQKFRNYNLYINRLDASIRDDPDKLQEQWEILNKSSKPLNKQELQRIVRLKVFKFIEEFHSNFINTPLFSKEKSVRGELTKEILKFIAMSESNIPKFNSLDDIGEKWFIRTFGTSKKDIDSNFEKYRDTIYIKCNLIHKYSDIISKKLELTSKINKKWKIPYQIIITRLVVYIENDKLLRRLLDKLIITIKDILDFNYKGGRNADYQRTIMNMCDEGIKLIILNDNEPRLFNSKMIKDKLEEQKNCCALCKKEIKEFDKYEGDHIKSWSSGGDTTYDNLQVVHTDCHKHKEEFLRQENEKFKKERNL